MAAAGHITYPCQLVFVGTTELASGDVVIGVEVKAPDVKTVGSVPAEVATNKARLLPCCNYYWEDRRYPQDWSDRFSTASPPKVTANVIVVARSAVVESRAHTLFNAVVARKQLPVTILSNPNKDPDRVGVLVISRCEVGFLGRWEQNNQAWNMQNLYFSNALAMDWESGVDLEIKAVCDNLAQRTAQVQEIQARSARGDLVLKQELDLVLADYKSAIERMADFQPTWITLMLKQK